MNALSRVQNQDAGPIIRMDDRTRFETAMQYAKTFSRASLLPEHLRAVRQGNKVEPLKPEEIEANCFLICNQALLWDIDPFSAISESYVVRGKLAFQGKLVAAVVNRELAKKLKPHYQGSGDDRQCTLVGTLKGENEPREVVVVLSKAKTDNQMWKSDPDQKLFYTAAIKWARRHLPEVLLGISSEDDPETIDAPRHEYPAIPDNSASGNYRVSNGSRRSDDEVLGKYVTRVSEATTEDELKRIVDDCQGEPTDLITDKDVERIKKIARDKWGLIVQARHCDEYQSQIDAAESKQALEEIAQAMYSDDRLRTETQKELGEAINQKGASLTE